VPGLNSGRCFSASSRTSFSSFIISTGNHSLKEVLTVVQCCKFACLCDRHHYGFPQGNRRAGGYALPEFVHFFESNRELGQRFVAFIGGTSKWRMKDEGFARTTCDP
jgi:hypothetical protein